MHDRMRAARTVPSIRACPTSCSGAQIDGGPYRPRVEPVPHAGRRVRIRDDSVRIRDGTDKQIDDLRAAAGWHDNREASRLTADDASARGSPSDPLRASRATHGAGSAVTHGVRPPSMTLLKHAVRQLILHAGAAGTIIAMLALGIGSATAIFALFYQVLVQPLPVPA